MRSRFRKAVLLSVTAFSLLVSSIPVYATGSMTDEERKELQERLGLPSLDVTTTPAPAPDLSDFVAANPELFPDGLPSSSSSTTSSGSPKLSDKAGVSPSLTDYDPKLSCTKDSTATSTPANALEYKKYLEKQDVQALGTALNNAQGTLNKINASGKAQQVQGTADIVECLKNAGSGTDTKKLEIKAGIVADIVTSLRGFGFSDPAIVGVLFNMNEESKFNAYTMQGMVDDDMLDWIYDIDTGYLKIDGQNPNVTTDKLTETYAARKYTAQDSKYPQSYADGVGLCQWTATRKIKLLAIGNKFSSDYKTCIWDVSGVATNWGIKSSDLGEFYEWSQYQPTEATSKNFTISQITIPSAAMQAAFLANAISDDRSGKEGMGDKGGWGDSPASDTEDYNKYGGFVEMTFDEYKGLDDYNLAAEAFAMHFERSGNKDRYDHIETICAALAPIMEIDTSSLMQASDSYSTVEESVNTVMNMATTGYITEDNLASFAQGAELNVDAQLLSGAVRFALNQSDLYSLANWERNVAYDNTDSKIISLGRKILVAIGIVFEVWSLLIYLAYWFDRLNNFIPIDLLNILTLGKLRIADSDTEATFSLRDNSTRTNVKTVNHRAVLFIAICGLAFGTLIVTGKLFTLLFGVVNFVRNLLK